MEILSPALHIGRTKKKKKRSASPVTGRSAKIWGHMDSSSALSGDTQDWSLPSTGNLYQQSPPFHSPPGAPLLRGPGRKAFLSAQCERRGWGLGSGRWGLGPLGAEQQVRAADSLGVPFQRAAGGRGGRPGRGSSTKGANRQRGAPGGLRIAAGRGESGAGAGARGGAQGRPAAGSGSREGWAPH